jgi:segregation and condensation protein B
MKAIVEGLLFLSGEDGLTLEEISNIIEKDISEVKEIIKELYNDYSNTDRGIQVEFLGDHFKLATKKEHREYYKKLTLNEESSILSQSALETLAIIAYNAPITRIDVDNIRGVNSSYVVRKLLLKGLIEEVGRSDAPGRPRLYNITPRFLDYFGLGSIDELPKLKEQEEVADEEKYLFESKYTEDE